MENRNCTLVLRTYMFQNKFSRNSEDLVYYVIIISPLIPSMDEQVEELYKRGLSTVYYVIPHQGMISKISNTNNTVILLHNTYFISWSIDSSMDD